MKVMVQTNRPDVMIVAEQDVSQEEYLQHFRELYEKHDIGTAEDADAFAIGMLDMATQHPVGTAMQGRVR